MGECEYCNLSEAVYIYIYIHLGSLSFCPTVWVDAEHKTDSREVFLPPIMAGK